MSQSLSKIYVHIILHIKKTSVTIGNDVKNELFAYMGSVIKDNDSIPILINGVEDHVHILCVLSKNITIAKLVEEIKRHSSRWIKTKGERYTSFAWQKGYAGFSVSSSLQEKTKSYIANQEEHHRKMTFKEELIKFLKEYGVEYNEEYLFDD
jgi:putative transposase